MLSCITEKFRKTIDIPDVNELYRAMLRILGSKVAIIQKEYGDNYGWIVYIYIIIIIKPIIYIYTIGLIISMSIRNHE